jgi:hypothetical protein
MIEWSRINKLKEEELLRKVKEEQVTQGDLLNNLLPSLDKPKDDDNLKEKKLDLSDLKNNSGT